MKSQTDDRHDYRDPVKVAALALLVWALLTVPALAHKVSIFAWVENGTVYTESKFSGGRAPKDSRIVVYDLAGNALLEGITDAEGRFSFPAPAAAGIRIALTAGQGHLAEWTVSAEELAATAASTKAAADTGGTAVTDAGMNRGATASALSAPDSSAADAGGLSVEDIRHSVADPLGKELQALRAEVRRLRQEIDNRPKVTDVLGGIGYIFGLVGVAAYFRSRRSASGRRS